MMRSDKRLSVIMPNYNHGTFLEARIRSILAQLGPDDEFIVVDDCSTDDSLQRIEKFLGFDTRLQLIKNERNLGAVESANLATKRARGEYLVYLASDDALLPGFIDKTMKVLIDNPEIGLACSDCAMNFEGDPEKNSQDIYTTRLIESVNTLSVYPPKEIVNVFRKTKLWIPGHTSIAKRDLIVKYGGHQKSMSYLSDWFLVHRIALEHGVAYIPESLAVWRQEAKCFSHQQRSDPKIARECQENLFNFLKEKQNRRLAKLFRQSGLLDFYARQVLNRLWTQPHHWGFILRLMKNYLFFRWNRYIRPLFMR